MMVLLGEVGGTEEYKVCEAIKNGTLTKPLVGWCIGTCADMFATDVQFGHAGNTNNLFLGRLKLPFNFIPRCQCWRFRGNCVFQECCS